MRTQMICGNVYLYLSSQHQKPVIRRFGNAVLRDYLVVIMYYHKLISQSILTPIIISCVLAG